MEEWLNYDDISVMPDIMTEIVSRKECNPYDENNMLPIFTAPMDTVVSIDNANEYYNNNIHVVIPRTHDINKRLLAIPNGYFISFSLNEAKEYFINKRHIPYTKTRTPMRICIDLANGHMKEVIDVIKEIKDFYGDTIEIMAGNIANPNSYKYYNEAGCDWVRSGIGGGSGCLTTSAAATGVPYFTLLKKMYEIKKSINGKCKIIADGNIRGYRDIQKALIYADAVMIGGLFNQALESSAKTTYGKSYFNIRGYKIFRPIKTLLTYGKEVKPKDYDTVAKKIKDGTLVVWKQFYGMSTKIAQEKINKANNVKSNKLKTSEGIVKYQKVEYTLSGWAENETDYLRSAMSYSNSRTLDEYKDSNWVRITSIRYNK